MTLMRRFLAPVLLLAASGASAQYLPPGPQTNGCPLLAVEARIDTISPRGEMVLTEVKRGELVVARITEETHYRLPGYSAKQIKEAHSVTFPKGTVAKFLICSLNGDVVDMKVPEDLSRKKQREEKKKKKKRKSKEGENKKEQ